MSPLFCSDESNRCLQLELAEWAQRLSEGLGMEVYTRCLHVGAGQSDLTNPSSREDPWSSNPAGSVTGLEDPIIGKWREGSKKRDFSRTQDCGSSVFQPQIRAAA